MANNGSYGGGDRNLSNTSDAEYANDPASGGFFNSDYKKHDDLKQMLDMNKDSMKLEAMKRIIGMIAKGRDASELFPAVVKNVVSKNIEVKKLVYVYLVRYAEQQQDLALLSISTFQRALKDPNQLIRGSALRVLSSIRVPMIVPIVMLAIKESAADLSSYVRKTVAHAIPKLYSLDPEQKEELILVINKLLSDKATLVVGSAVMAFEEVCPERFDLIHKNFRKLCSVLVDVDEWGQVIIVNMLTRYARTQFVDPNLNANYVPDNDRAFYTDDDDSASEPSSGGRNNRSCVLDVDHKTLLRSARPLLQSRNAAVVMSVAQLYHHVAPKSDVTIVAKSLIRLLRSHREVQSVVLNSIASISIARKDVFEPFLKSFFVRTSEPTHIKILKLEILTNLATESSISVILREFQTYVTSSDKQFVAVTIQAIGRCASNISEVKESCLNGLVLMLSKKDEAVVAESVVVIKKLLQTHPSSHTDIIKQMAKLSDNIMVPQARASILWLLGEYSQLVPKIAPDVLRKMAKSFITEEDMVKLQILNLAAKLYLTNEEQTKLLCEYVLTLARYDQNYDIRDRSRFLRKILFPANENSKLSKYAKEIFLAAKPAPLIQSKFIDREEFKMGSLSHYINVRAIGYQDLPAFPEIQPDPSVREVPLHSTTKEQTKHSTTTKKKKSFYSDSGESTVEEGSEVSADENSDELSDGDSSVSDTSSSEPTYTKKAGQITKNEESEDEYETESGDSESESEESGSDKSEDEEPKKEPVQNQSKPSNIDLLLELDDLAPIAAPVMTSTQMGLFTPVSTSTTSSIQLIGPQFTPVDTFELLSKMNTSGQLSVKGKFNRVPNLFSSAMASVELHFQNHSSVNLTDIKIGQKMLGSGVSIHEFPTITNLAPSEKRVTSMGINFNDSIQPVTFEIIWNSNDSVKSNANISIRAPVGELIRSVTVSEEYFIQEHGKLKGMNEHSASVPWNLDEKLKASRSIYEAANFGPVQSFSDNLLRFAGQTLSSTSLVLLSVLFDGDNKAVITVNCEKMVVGSMMLNHVKNHLSKNN